MRWLRVRSNLLVQQPKPGEDVSSTCEGSQAKATNLEECKPRRHVRSSVQDAHVSDESESNQDAGVVTTTLVAWRGGGMAMPPSVGVLEGASTRVQPSLHCCRQRA
jgi:hypothetical protein